MSASQSQDMRKLSEVSLERGWMFLAYQTGLNKAYVVREGRVELIHPKTDQVNSRGVGSGIRHQADPAFAPDGKQVAFVRQSSPGPNNEVIAVQNLSDGTSLDLVSLPMFVYSVSWAPNGKEIAFIAEKANDKVTRFGLYIVRLEDRQITPLTPGSFLDPNSSASWSPDGQEIAVVAWPEGTAKERRDSVVVVKRASGSQRSIAYGRYPSWSLDGEVIAYLDGQHCYTIRPDGTNSQLLFSFNRWPLRRWYTLKGPLLWSPDMKYLIYHREDGEKGDSRKIYLLDLKSNEKKEIFSGYPLELVGWTLRRFW